MPFISSCNNNSTFFAKRDYAHLAYAFSHISDDTEKKAKGEKKRDAPECSKKHHSSYKREKKIARVEDTLNPLTTPPEILSSDTNKVVAAFKGAIPLSYYANDNLLYKWLNVLFTKKWSPPKLAYGGIMWTYIEFSDGTTTKEAFDSVAAYPGAVPSDRYRAYTPPAELVLSQDDILLDERSATPPSPHLVGARNGWALCLVCWALF